MSKDQEGVKNFVIVMVKANPPTNYLLSSNLLFSIKFFLYTPVFPLFLSTY